ncbi:hypothetical protein FHX11_002854 [Rhizobium sp. BK602]|nr:hypothetical protein [Rhizobium sp. BK602]
MLVDEAVASGWHLRHVVCAIILMAAEKLSDGEEKRGADSFHS